MLDRLVPISVICAVALSACDDGDEARPPQSTPDGATPQRDERRPPGLPSGVPLRASGAADPARAKVIRDWAGALRGGDVAAASALWGVPSIVQNGTPVLTLRSRADVRLFNRSLPCGAIVTAARGAARDFTIVTVRLTQRRGGDCGTGIGNSARTAIRVRGAKIVEWYRLPDDPDGPAPGAAEGPTVQS
ncbi:MAG: hypothetical protein ACRDLS_13800 [Solirubrobacteraceae bacterium]